MVHLKRLFMRRMVPAACGVLLAAAAVAQAPAALPLQNLGLEHLDIIVPDTEASARFRAGMGRVLEGAGFAGIRGTGGLGMWPDPDGLELQLFQPPAGLVTAAVKSPLPVEGDGLVTPRGVDHVLLRVSSLDKSLPYYRMVYGAAAERPRDAQGGRVWFQLDNNTRIGLQAAPAGEPPTIEHYAIKVAPFDRDALTSRLRDLGVRTLPAPDEPDVFRFEDNNRIVVELRVAG
jgi:catechol 2,3-dioxygenase-like lactoylglutathione lyase family enzyme